VALASSDKVRALSAAADSRRIAAGAAARACRPLLSQFTTVDEYLELFDAPMAASISAEASFPLPPRLTYRTG